MYSFTLICGFMSLCILIYFRWCFNSVSLLLLVYNFLCMPLIIGLKDSELTLIVFLFLLIFVLARELICPFFSDYISIFKIMRVSEIF